MILLIAFRINQDDFRTVLCRLTQFHSHHLRIIEANYQNHLCRQQLVDGIWRSVHAQHFLNSTLTVVKAQRLCSDGLCQLLHHIGFLVGVAV